ncbi:MAG TPA: MmcQ/YjbR family DNA-binding protein [Candidatus Binataceae bacterium]|nr:MmcQ/YjbR family DNA-binding protein [Candidatus Binataceae bacterium]
MTFDSVRRIARSLPEVAESMIHGKPALKVSGKLLACVPVHSSAEAGCAAVRIDLVQRAALLRESPQTYYVTDHYVAYPMVLVRLARIEEDKLRDLLRRSWEFVTGKAAGSRSKERSKPSAVRTSTTTRHRPVSRKS